MQISLTPDDVRLAASFDDKWQAIDACGEFLVERGYVTPAYIETMRDRERQTTVYLGNNVAIPHSTLAGKAHILRTGVVVVQVPGGVPFDESTAHVLIGIAGAGDDHLEVISALALVLSDMDKVNQIRNATTREEILATLADAEA